MHGDIKICIFIISHLRKGRFFHANPAPMFNIKEYEEQQQIASDNDTANLNRDMNLFGKMFVDKFKKLKVFVHGLRGVELYS